MCLCPYVVTGDFMDAETAVRVGLINRVVSPESLHEEVLKLSAKIATKSPAAIRSGKDTFLKQSEMGIRDAYALASDTMVSNLCSDSSGDATEGINAFLEKRAPIFKDRF